MAHRLEQVQRSHDVRLECQNGICPRHCGQTLRSQVEDVCRLVLLKKLFHALAIAQITLDKLEVPQLGEGILLIM
jgi:hypothetical protein